MSDPGSDAWTCPDAGPDGFVEVALLRQRARAGLEEFVREFPVPALYTIVRSDGPEGEDADPQRSGVQLLTMSIKSASTLRYLGRVAFLAKRPGNPFAHLVSIGRSEKNDITVAVDSVSKVHGYFVREDDGWAFNDHSSTNGSFLDERPLVPGEKAPLASGSTLRLGLEVTFEVLAPEDLHRRLVG